MKSLLLAALLIGLAACSTENNGSDDGADGSVTGSQTPAATSTADAATHTTTQPSDDAGHHGAPKKPLPVGSTITMKIWEVSVTGPSEISDEPRDPNWPEETAPKEGHVHVVAPVTTKRIDDNAEAITLSLDMTIDIVGASGVTYGSDGMSSCYPTDEDLPQWSDVYPGGTASGDVCVGIPREEVNGAVWRIREGFRDPEEAFVALK